jgi:hypothetical protein
MSPSPSVCWSTSASLASRIAILLRSSLMIVSLEEFALIALDKRARLRSERKRVSVCEREAEGG